MTFTLFVGMALAAYRISRFIIADSILDKPRDAFKRRFPPDKEWARYYSHVIDLGPGRTAVAWSKAGAPQRKPNKFSEGLFCFWCSGFWVSGIVVLVVSNLTTVELPVLWWLAVSSAVGLTARNLDV